MRDEMKREEFFLLFFEILPQILQTNSSFLVLRSSPFFEKTFWCRVALLFTTRVYSQHTQAQHTQRERERERDSVSPFFYKLCS